MQFYSWAHFDFFESQYKSVTGNNYAVNSTDMDLTIYP